MNNLRIKLENLHYYLIYSTNSSLRSFFLFFYTNLFLSFFCLPLASPSNTESCYCIRASFKYIIKQTLCQCLYLGLHTVPDNPYTTLSKERGKRKTRHRILTSFRILCRAHCIWMQVLIDLSDVKIRTSRITRISSFSLKIKEYMVLKRI